MYKYRIYGRNYDYLWNSPNESKYQFDIFPQNLLIFLVKLVYCSIKYDMVNSECRKPQITLDKYGRLK